MSKDRAAAPSNQQKYPKGVTSWGTFMLPVRGRLLCLSLSLSRSLWLSLPLLLAVGQSAQGPRTRARTGLTVCCDTSSLDRGPHLVCYYPKRCTLPMYPPGLVLHWLEKCRHCSLSPQPISLFAHLSLSLSLPGIGACQAPRHHAHPM